MKMLKSILRYYTIFCICQFLVILWDQKMEINQFSILGIVFVPVFIAPLHTLFVAGIHYLNINQKIFGNLVCEIFTSFFPSLIIGIYSYVALLYTENHYILSEDGKCLYRKWYLDDMNIVIMSYVALFFILFIHGKKKQ